MLEVLGFAAVSAAILYTPKFCAWLCGWVGLAVASAVIGLFMNFVMSVEA